MILETYDKPKGKQGQGKDIRWCGRNQGGKKCGLCKHHAKYSVWSSEWFWYYLESWSYYKYWEENVSYKYNKEYKINHIRPVKYHTTGLRAHSVISLLRKGCKLGRKCKCVSLIQRGYWYCPQCWVILHEIAKSRNEHPHNLMIIPRQELKTDVLILKLSGVI
jgi:hypothetical protein